MSSDLARVREIRKLADMVVAEMQTEERPSTESAGIAYVAADGIVDIVDDWERDLLSVPRTVPIDRRCPACGVDRAGCRSATCIRRAAA